MKKRWLAVVLLALTGTSFMGVNVNAQDRQIHISSPLSEIYRQGEPLPISRQIEGYVDGFSKSQLKTLNVEVFVLISFYQLVAR